MTEIKPLIQRGEPDCSLLSCLNAVRFNTPDIGKNIDQNTADKLMPLYTRNSVLEGVKFLREQWYDLKYLPVSYSGAKNLMKRGRAIICRRKYNKNWFYDVKDDWEANGTAPIDIDVKRSWHFFVLKQEWEKYRAWDSNAPFTYLVDLEHYHREGVIGDTFYQVK